jgi:hypothetical protein
MEKEHECGGSCVNDDAFRELLAETATRMPKEPGEAARFWIAFTYDAVDHSNAELALLLVRVVHSANAETPFAQMLVELEDRSYENGDRCQVRRQLLNALHMAQSTLAVEKCMLAAAWRDFERAEAVYPMLRDH